VDAGRRRPNVVTVDAKPVLQIHNGTLSWLAFQALELREHPAQIHTHMVNVYLAPAAGADLVTAFRLEHATVDELTVFREVVLSKAAYVSALDNLLKRSQELQARSGRAGDGFIAVFILVEGSPVAHLHPYGINEDMSGASKWDPDWLNRAKSLINSGTHF
jgi:hypothetical protein